MRIQLTQLIAKSLFAVTLTVSFIAPPEAFAEDLLVSTAISVKGALFDISKKFEAKYPGTRVVLNGASSGELAAQIENGAPVDVFVSANNKEMVSLDKHKLLAGQPRPFVYNRLVITTPLRCSPIKSMNDLKRFTRIAIGNSGSVPAGRYAEEALQSANLLSVLRDKHALIYGQNARALLTYVEQGNVDAAFIYYTDYLSSKKVGPAFTIPKNMTEPIAYEMATLIKSHHAALAEKFMEFALSDSNKPELLKYHFERSWN